MNLNREKASLLFPELTIKDDYLIEVLQGKQYLLFDGAMGTMLQDAGLQMGELPELLNLKKPSLIMKIHEEYVQAGAQVVTTNTFGANSHKLGDDVSISKVFQSAISCARESGARYVAADIGPIGALMAPLGTMSFDEAYEVFQEQVIAAQAAAADIILIETMTDLLEMKAAVLAAKENTSLPIFATMTFEEDGRTFLGTSPEIAAITLSSLGVHAVGVNCSMGPADLASLVQKMLDYAKCPVMVQANAGLPKAQSEANASYDISPKEYAQSVNVMVEAGVGIIGGCCGTTPEYTRELAKLLRNREPIERVRTEAFALTSAQNAVLLPHDSHDIAVIGERINPTGKPKLKEALRNQNYDYVIEEALRQQEAGADILDVNVGLPELDEPEILATVVQKLQSITPLPLQIDSSDAEAIEKSAREYCGKPLINSVNGKRESLEAILPIAHHYGCAVLGLTLDEEGIPPTAEERFAIARHIVVTAESYGIPKSDIAIDCLVMAASTNQQEINEILRAVYMVKEKLGVKTVLGVSNVSFGLPQRELINATFLASAFGVGLDMPILNPLSERYRDAVASYRVLNAQDEKAQSFITEYANKPDPYLAKTSKACLDSEKTDGVNSDQLSDEALNMSEEDHVVMLIETGRKAQMKEATEKLLKTHDPLWVIDEVFIPALNIVGEKFEKGEFFLPQLMTSAEAVKEGFTVVKDHAEEGSQAVAEKGKICVATVKGDVHDIGKNIVKMLLENYGYRVYDLGRDVDPQAVVDAVKKFDISLVGLSALMTTTVRSMEETIALLRKEVPECKVFVGGAVLSPEYAELVGADFYGKDAAASARIAEEFFGSL